MFQIPIVDSELRKAAGEEGGESSEGGQCGNSYFLSYTNIVFEK